MAGNTGPPLGLFVDSFQINKKQRRTDEHLRREGKGCETPCVSVPQDTGARQGGFMMNVRGDEMKFVVSCAMEEVAAKARWRLTKLYAREAAEQRQRRARTGGVAKPGHVQHYKKTQRLIKKMWTRLFKLEDKLVKHGLKELKGRTDSGRMKGSKLRLSFIF